MQEHYKDGTEGPIVPLTSIEQLEKSLEKPEVDHVRVFKANHLEAREAKKKNHNRKRNKLARKSRRRNRK